MINYFKKNLVSLLLILHSSCLIAMEDSSMDPAPFEKSSEKSSHSINLLWVNRKPTQSCNFFSDFGNNEKNYTENAKGWANLHKDVTLWYDLASEKAIDSTRESLEEEGSSLKLKSVRDLQIVQDNIHVLSDILPCYFRVDWLKVAMGYESILKNPKSDFIFADLDMNPISKDKLFDEETENTLQTFGTVMSRGGYHGFENQFQMIRGGFPNLMQAMKTAQLDLNAARASLALKKGYYVNGNGKMESSNPMRPLQQIVYDSYPPMFELYYHLQGWGKLQCKISTFDHSLEKITGYGSHVKDEIVPYDLKAHGINPFGIYQRMGSQDLGRIGYLSKSIKYYSFESENPLVTSEKGLTSYPTKDVGAPKPSLIYY